MTSFLMRKNSNGSGCTHPFLAVVALSILLSSIACDGLRSSVQADDEVAKKLLKDFWSHTKKKQTDNFYDSRPTKNKNALYAYALVKSRQHDVKKALDAIDALHQVDDKSPQSWRLKTWLLLRQDKFNGSVVALGKFIERVKTDKSIDDFSRSEAFRFAGRVFAFLEGPVKPSVNHVAADTLKRKILFKLDGDLTNAFVQDYNDVEKKYRQMMGDKAKHEQNFAKVDAEQRKTKFAQLTQFEDQLKETKSKLQEQSGTIREAATKELEALRKQDEPLASLHSSIQGELSVINGDLIGLVNDYNYWNNLALRELDRWQRAYYFRQAGRIDSQIIQLELAASQVRRRLNAIESERMALRRQFAATNAIASNQLASINQETQNINKQQRRASNEKVKTTKPTKKIITHSVSLKTKARSIVTYEQFPLEIERQLLLDELK